MRILFHYNLLTKLSDINTHDLNLIILFNKFIIDSRELFLEGLIGFTYLQVRILKVFFDQVYVFLKSFLGL